WMLVNLTTSSGQASNVIWTPTITSTENVTITCAVVNVSAQARTIKISLFRALSTIPLEKTITLQPEQFDSIGLLTGPGAVDNDHCKFTVTDGTSSDIRGSIQLCTNGPFACNQAAVPAQ